MPLTSSLRQSLVQDRNTNTEGCDSTDISTQQDDILPAFDDYNDDISFKSSYFLEELVPMPNSFPDSPIWTKAATTALLGKSDSSLVEVQSINDEFDHDSGEVTVSDLIKPNYYRSLWYSGLDTIIPQWQFDLELR
ncbi:hypothetical protein PsorP6_001419 [Peronosclerospora sorghi]|uniref:Uncharacterized protein n=1 Tax=Peronosclerospora sorghi TaxID=230839 RepID=A0ACC0WSS2_9STRA|nr:hypothetical protein PsorP6_001419 [Peronosclerospora sorghi]